MLADGYPLHFVVSNLNRLWDVKRLNSHYLLVELTSELGIYRSVFFFNLRGMLINWLCVARHIKSNEHRSFSIFFLQISFSFTQLQEDLPMDQYTSTVPQLHGRLDPVSYGSYSDAAIPFPRTSGAKFCACGELIVQKYLLKLPDFNLK